MNYYVMTSIEYFKSHWLPLRVGAAAFVGYAMGNVPPDRQHTVGLNPAIITSGLSAESARERHDVVRD